MKVEETYIKQIESESIKKIIDKIYGSNLENKIDEEKLDRHSEIVKELESLEIPKRSIWERLNFFYKK